MTYENGGRYVPDTYTPYRGPEYQGRNFYDRGYYNNGYYGRNFGYNRGYFSRDNDYYGTWPYYGRDYYNNPSYGRYSGYGPRNYTRSDDRIREDVNDGLTWHGDLDATDINVDVNDGVVRLTGSVDSRQDKRLAEDIADSVSGVWDVNNQLSIRSRRSQANSPGIAGSSAPQRAPTG